MNPSDADANSRKLELGALSSSSWLRACALPASPPVLILFDHGTPKGASVRCLGTTLHTAKSRGWDTLSNGALLTAAERQGSSCCSRLTGASANSRTCKYAGSPSSRPRVQFRAQAPMRGGATRVASSPTASSRRRVSSVSTSTDSAVATSVRVIIGSIARVMPAS